MKHGRVSIYLTIIFFWCGFVYLRISYHLGGIALVGTGYVLLALSLFPWKLSFAREKHDMNCAIACMIVFWVINTLGTEIGGQYSSSKVFFGLVIANDTFNFLKNMPLWLAMMLSLALYNETFSYCKLVLVLLLIDMLCTLPALEAVPEFAKLSTAGIVTAETQRFRLFGAMGYELAYSVALMVPVIFVFGLKHKRVWYCVVAILGTYFVFKCSFMLALIVMVLNIFLSVLMSLRNKALRSITMVVTMAIGVWLFIEQETIGQWLLQIAPNIESYELRIRFEQLGEAFAYGDTSGGTLNRIDLYMRDIEYILQSPIVGLALFDNSYFPCEHSSILDIWSAMGLVGLIPYLASIWYSYKYAVRDITQSYVKGVITAAYLSFLFLATVNPVFSYPHIMSVVWWMLPCFSRSLVPVQCRPL